MPRVPDLPCADCGKLMWRGSTSLPEGQARCHPCRRLRPTLRTATCEQCGVDFQKKQPGPFCSVNCYGLSIRLRPSDNPQVKRRHREGAAPGLSAKRRAKLLGRWKRQQKPCAYCGDHADTVDHVMPLVRGGTNYEGNLIPACRRCNSSKSGKTVIEWRHGVSLGAVKDLPEWLGKPPKPRADRPAKVPREPHNCPICKTSTMRLVYCSPECQTERKRRDTRDAYRFARGLPVDRDKPVKRRASLMVA